MESTHSLVALVLAGFMFGAFSGVAGIIVRRLVARRFPSAHALSIGMLAGGATGAAATSMMHMEVNKAWFVILTAAVGALLPWVFTWRLFEANDAPEEDSGGANRPGSSA